MLTALRARLLAKTGVTNLVGSRVYAFRATQGADYPQVRMQRVGGDHAQHMTGAAGWVRLVVQIDSIGSGDGGGASALATAEAVRNALQGWSGTQSGVAFRSVRLIDERDLFDSDQGGGQAGYPRVSQDYEITYQESVPVH